MLPRVRLSKSLTPTWPNSPERQKAPRPARIQGPILPEMFEVFLNDQTAMGNRRETCGRTASVPGAGADTPVPPSMRACRTTSSAASTSASRSVRSYNTPRSAIKLDHCHTPTRHPLQEHIQRTAGPGSENKPELDRVPATDSGNHGDLGRVGPNGRHHIGIQDV